MGTLAGIVAGFVIGVYLDGAGVPVALTIAVAAVVCWVVGDLYDATIGKRP